MRYDVFLRFDTGVNEIKHNLSPTDAKAQIQLAALNPHCIGARYTGSQNEMRIVQSFNET